MKALHEEPATLSWGEDYGQVPAGPKTIVRLS
jgi:hypothetical protein